MTVSSERYVPEAHGENSVESTKLHIGDCRRLVLCRECYAEMAVQKDTRFVQCDQCARWFSVSGPGNLYSDAGRAVPSCNRRSFHTANEAQRLIALSRRAELVEALKKCDGSVRRVASEFGVDIETIYTRVRRYEIGEMVVRGCTNNSMKKGDAA